MRNNNEVKILSNKQALFYTDNGVQPLRIERGYDDKVVYVFSKESTSNLYGQWLTSCREYRARMRHPETITEQQI